jgi:hypothetical protein
MLGQERCAAIRRGRDASYPTPPAQIPACGFPAPGSSVRLASAIPVAWEKAIPLREVGWCAPALHVRHQFPVRAASHRHPLPHVDGSPALRVLRGDPTPHGPSAILAVRPTCVQESMRSPKFLTLLSTHTTLLVDPGRPSGSSPKRFLCVGFWGVKTIAVCMSRDHGAVSSFRECGLSYGLRGSLCTLHLVRLALLPPLQMQHSV